MIQVELPADVPIFEDLIVYADNLARRGESVRIIGGVAMTLWGLALARPRGVATNDIDAVVPSGAAADSDSARTFARNVHAATAAAGYALPADPKPAERFAFIRDSDYGEAGRRKIEMIVGRTTIGRTSKRPPPVRHLVEDDHGLRLSAAVNPWLELVPEPWTTVEIRHVDGRCRLEIPGCIGLYILKLRAVRDKQQRVAEEKDPTRKKFEITRLSRHLDDLALTRSWIALRNESDALRRATAVNEQVPLAAAAAEQIGRAHV